MTTKTTLDTIQQKLSKPSGKRHRVGHLGELAAVLLLERAGYKVHIPETRTTGDLHAINPNTGELIRVEVKTARRGKDRKWRFTLLKIDPNDGSPQTDHRYSDIVLLLAVTLSGALVPFVIPVQAVAARHQIAITSDPRTYGGRFAIYRQRATALTLAEVH